MDDSVQLELFDLRPYTSEQPAAIESQEQLFEQTQQDVDYRQLELDLFPEQAQKIFLPFVRLAA